MATGATWKVDLVAYLSTNIGPTLTPTAPVGTVFPGAAIEWSTSDPDDGDDQTKAILTLTDPLMNTHNAVVAGVVQAGFSGGATPNTSGGFDWSITVDDGMDSGTWSAYAYCEDFAGVSDDDTWGWTVDSPPTLTGTYPPTGTSTYEHTLVSFTTTDDLGVVAVTLELDLTAPDGTVYHPVVSGAFNTVNGWNGTIVANTSNGYDVVLTSHPVFAVGTWQAVAACDDTIGQSATDTWTFTITQSRGAFYLGS